MNTFQVPKYVFDIVKDDVVISTMPSFDWALVVAHKNNLSVQCIQQRQDGYIEYTMAKAKKLEDIPGLKV